MPDAIRRYLDVIRKQQELLDPAETLKAMLEPSKAMQDALKAEHSISDILKANQPQLSAVERLIGTGLVDSQTSTHGLEGRTASYLGKMSANACLIDWMGTTSDPMLSIRDLADLGTEINSALRQSGVSEVQRLALELNSRGVSADIVRSIESLTSARTAYEQEFRLPQFREIELLVRGFDHYPALSGAAALESGVVQKAMEQMHSPWLQTTNSAASASAFADLICIGHGIQQLGPFDEALTSLLRTSLGDWREDVPQSIALADPFLRAEFYRDRGFNPAIVNFPATAFEEGLHVAGFQVWQEIEIVEEAGDGTTHAAVAFRTLRRLETAIRAFIVERLAACYGEKWYQHQLPHGMLQSWTEKKEKDTASRSDLPLIEYADFSDYIKIIERKDNWTDTFQEVFGRKEDVQESFRRLGPIRINTMHARLVLKEDLLLMASESTRLLNAIKGAAPSD